MHRSPPADDYSAQARAHYGDIAIAIDSAFDHLDTAMQNVDDLAGGHHITEAELDALRSRLTNAITALREVYDPVGDRTVPVRTVDGVRCTNRAGIAALAGWKPGNTVHVRANTDPDFPRPIGKLGRDYWYPFAGEHGVDAYLIVLADRAAAKKPPPAKAGDPDQLLDPEQAADAMHIAPATFRSYVRHSVPIWEGRKTGRPLIPPPDEVVQVIDANGVPHQSRRWYRRTLAEHQARRPGPGTGGGRPKGTSKPRM